MIPHAEAAERAIAGAALQSHAGARLVADLVDTDLIYGPLRAVVVAAVELPEDADPDLSGCEDGVLLDRHLVVDGQALTGAVLRRVVAVALAVGDPVMAVAELVADLPAHPTERTVSRWGREITEAAVMREAALALESLRLRLAEEPDLAERLVRSLAPVAGVLPTAGEEPIGPPPAPASLLESTR